MTKIIGLTGGIGSGKTTVAKLFAEKGIPVYIADDAGRKVMDNANVIASIREIFGESIVFDGKLLRQKLAEIVFADPAKLSQLNKIVHPAVFADFSNWLKTHNTFPIVIKETAILFESGSDRQCDAVITVTAPIELRISRVIKRDGVSHEEVLKRIESQWTDEMRISKSDFIIVNDLGANLDSQVSNILKKLHNF